MSPLHINMTNVFHTGRPRGELTTATSVTSNHRPLPTSRSLSDLFTKLKRILAKYAGFVGPGILISIAYMVKYPWIYRVALTFRTRGITLPTSLQVLNFNINSSVSSSFPTYSRVTYKLSPVNSEASLG